MSGSQVASEEPKVAIDNPFKNDLAISIAELTMDAQPPTCLSSSPRRTSWIELMFIRAVVLLPFWNCKVLAVIDRFPLALFDASLNPMTCVARILDVPAELFASPELWPKTVLHPNQENQAHECATPHGVSIPPNFH